MSTEDKKIEHSAQAGFNRRGFIRQAGVGAAAAAATGALSVSAAAATAPAGSKAKTAGVDYDVIVVGAGFAGVTAARDARKAGYKVLMLEARDRIGGRTYTREFAGHKIEMGGTWIHWSQPFVWAEKDRYGMAIVETPVDGTVLENEEVVIKTGDTYTRLPGEALGPMLEAFNAYFEESRKVWDRPFDSKYAWAEVLKHDKTSARQHLEKMKLKPLEKVAVESYLTAIVHGPIAEAGYVDLLRYWALSGWNLQGVDDALARYKLKEGTSALLQKMLDDGKPELRLNSPVKRIEDKGVHTVVTTQKGETFSAAQVIVTVPMNVLPGLEFSPPLHPAKLAAGKQKHNGVGAKYFVKAKGHYTKTAKITAMADESYAFNLAFVHALGKDHTVFVVFATDASKLDFKDTKAVERALKPFFPEIKVEATFGHDWAHDPYALGTWASYKTEWFGKYVEHFEKEQGRIMFATGDHGEGWRGFIDGAIGSGARAAQRLQKKLG